MRFRPCIDIHNGKVKQIIGSSLADKDDRAAENFVSEYDSAYYSSLFKERGLKGGHVIMLNASSSPYYEATKAEALKALKAFPGALQAGGGIDDKNAAEFTGAGASHVIVTSYIFEDGKISLEKIKALVDAVGKEKIVLDLSCRQHPQTDPAGASGEYFIVTDRWQTFTSSALTPGLLHSLSAYCDEFLVHAVDVEGKKQGVDEDVLKILASSPIPVTYAGGVSSFEHINTINRIGNGKIDVTIGSALSIFGGALDFDEAIDHIENI